MTVERTRLPNGLTVVVERHAAAPVVAVQAWVQAGSADETDAVAGVAHLHEHMLFKGTASRPRGEIARAIERRGGEINAWTSHDQTVYHLVVPKVAADEAVLLLGDAITAPQFAEDEVAREIEVVLEEIRRAQDTPSRRVANALFELAYTHHPYRRPVIGSEGTVRSLTSDSLRTFHRAHYGADGLTLVVVGDVEPDAIVRTLERCMGQAPRCEKSTSPRVAESVDDELRVRVLRESVREARLSLGFRAPPLLHADTAALDVLAIILGHDESSRLFRAARLARRCVTDVHAYAYTPRDPGLLMLSAVLAARDMTPAVAVLLQETERLARVHPSIDELERAKLAVRAESAYQGETAQGQARKHGFFESSAGDWAYEAVYLERVRSVTGEDVRRVAERYLQPAPAVVVQADAGELMLEDAEVRDLVSRSRKPSRRRGKKSDQANAGVRIVELDSGALLLVKREPGPIVAMRAVAPGGLLFEKPETNGITTMVSALWGLATITHPRAELTQVVARLGGHLGAFAGRNTVGLRGEFIVEHAMDGLGTFVDVLCAPVFAPTDFERERDVLLSRIDARDDNPSGVAFDAFCAALYPGHPYGLRSNGTRASVGALTLADVERFVGTFCSPDKLAVAVVGDVEVEQVLDVLGSSLAHQGPPLPQRTAPPPVPLAKAETARRVLEKKQTHLLVGGLGARLADPERLPLEVLMTVLGGQGGRLFAKLRDESGLAYAVSATNVEGVEPGYALVHVGTSPARVEEALGVVYGELAILAEHGPTDDELARAKAFLVGTHSIDLQRAGARAMTMALNQRLGLGWDAAMRYPGDVERVTAVAVREVTRRFLDRERLLTVIVGPRG